MQSFNNSTKRRQPGEDFGLTFESSLIPLVPYQTDDVGIKTTNFGNGGFDERQQFVLDHSTINDKSVYSDPDSFCDMHWSPLGCTADGRSILATLSANGEVYVHTLTSMLGQWEPTFKVSKILQTYLNKNSWLGCDKEPQGLKGQMKEFSRRKHLLFTVALCWCPVVWTCNKCLVNQLPDNMYFTSYFINFACCSHGKFMLCTASKNGCLFLWNLNYNKLDSSKHEIDIACVYKTDIYWPSSISWFQLSMKDALIAVGFANGLIVLHHFEISYSNNSQEVRFRQKVNIWDQEDEITVTNLSFIKTKQGRLHLVGSKGPEIVIFRDVTLDPTLCSLTIEQAPSCHSSAIVSLQCVKGRFIVSASNGATQYVDIENEIQPFFDNNILRGFRCCGIAADPSLCMFVRVSCPSRLLLLQSSFVKQMEVSCLPFLSTEDIAQLLLNNEINLDVIVREYFLVCAAENFILPNILHRYCDAPDTYDKPTKELHIYLYFNRMRYIQTTGMRSNALTNEELHELWKNDKIEDETIQRLDRAVERQFFKEMLSKFLQLMENDWITMTESGCLTLKLISDYLVRFDSSSNAIDFPRRCFTRLKETSTLEALDRFEQTPVENDKNDKENDLLSERDWNFKREKCPFCNVDIALDGLYRSKCPNGHWYTRCGLTLQSCKLRIYRSCIGCERKVSSKDTSGKLTIESILLNIDSCPFCGCRLIECFR